MANEIKDYKLFIQTYDKGYRNKTVIILARYKTYDEAYKHWIDLVLNYPDHEGQFGVDCREESLLHY